MFCLDNIDTVFFVFSDALPSLLYYSHLPVMMISLLLGFFVYFKSEKSLAGKILFFISILFALWIFLNLIIWTNSNSSLIIFLWSLIGLLHVLICFASLYFVYAYIDKKDVNFRVKIIMSVLILPMVLLLPTNFNLELFDLVDCEAFEGIYFTNYYYTLGFIAFIWILFFSFFRYRKANTKNRRQILLLVSGIEFFLVFFFVSGFVASYLDNFELEQYGLFGMIIFMGMLTYMIVKFEAFHIKLLGAQALVVALIILIAAQFTFIRNPINMTLNGVALFLITIFGYILIRGVKREIAQKESLAIANKEISERKNQLQKISDHLAVANDKLKELDTAKTEFVSIVAHQLQGPPTTVKGYSTLLLEGSYGEVNTEQVDILKKIFNANEQQIEFVNDLLSVSRLESGRVMFDFDNYQIQEICQEVVDNLLIKAKDKGLYLELIKPEKLIPEIKIDRAKIKEAIANLVDNAVKYTKRGGVNISLQICSLKNDKCLPGNHLRITVSDTGIGIPADEMPRMFSKFSRGKDVKRLNAGGTGLGLYVVKMIVEGNKGQVWVESDGDGKGSRFIIELPIV